MVVPSVTEEDHSGRSARVVQEMGIFITQTHCMRNKNIMNRGNMRDTRKGLRNNSTPAEIALWLLLKNRQLDGRKFRRQTSIENYVVDFCCVEERIVIELDGGIHSHPAVAENDKHRDDRLADLGYKVLRFDNQDVFNLPDWVQGEIRKVFGA